MAHRWSAAPLTGASYDDTGFAAVPWPASPVALGGAFVTSQGDYSWGTPVLVGDNAVATGDLYSGDTRSFALDGTQGLAVTPGDGLQTAGSSARGLTVGLWFRMDATRSAVNQGHNTLFALSDATGATLKLVVTAGRPAPRLSKPRLLVLVTRLVSDDTTFASDYGVSETDAPGGPRASKFAAKPNGGAVLFTARVLNTAWQHVAVTFNGAGVLNSVFCAPTPFCMPVRMR